MYHLNRQAHQCYYNHLDWKHMRCWQALNYSHHFLAKTAYLRLAVIFILTILPLKWQTLLCLLQMHHEFTQNLLQEGHSPVSLTSCA